MRPRRCPACGHRLPRLLTRLVEPWLWTGSGCHVRVPDPDYDSYWGDECGCTDARHGSPLRPQVVRRPVDARG